jgi:hypothetical protein
MDYGMKTIWSSRIAEQFTNILFNIQFLTRMRRDYNFSSAYFSCKIFISMSYCLHKMSWRPYLLFIFLRRIFRAGSNVSKTFGMIYQQNYGLNFFLWKIFFNCCFYLFKGYGTAQVFYLFLCQFWYNFLEISWIVTTYQIFFHKIIHHSLFKCPTKKNGFF